MPEIDAGSRQRIAFFIENDEADIERNPRQSFRNVGAVELPGYIIGTFRQMRGESGGDRSRLRRASLRRDFRMEVECRRARAHRRADEQGPPIQFKHLIFP